MPNRIIKETICTSPNIDQLSSEAENFFYRLMVNCDDYGRCDARLTVLLSKCFPLRIGKLTLDQIKGWLEECAKADLLILYRVGGEYIQLKKWSDHQTIRAKRSKYPAPDSASEIICMQMHADESGCKQLNANVPVIQSNPIQSARASAFDLEALYSAYPKRKGSNRKAEAIKTLTKRIKTQEDYDAHKEAIRRYSDECRATGKSGTEFVMQFATFINGVWTEYSNPSLLAPPARKTIEETIAELSGKEVIKNGESK